VPGESLKLKKLKSLVEEHSPAVFSNFTSRRDAVAYLKQKVCASSYHSTICSQQFCSNNYQKDMAAFSLCSSLLFDLQPAPFMLLSDLARTILI
jgi:hypothetical protein